MNQRSGETLDRRQMLRRAEALAGMALAAAACKHAAGLSGPRVRSDGENGYESHTTTPPEGS